MATSSCLRLSHLIFSARLNPTVDYVPHRQALSPSNALEIISGYDLVLDCTDNPSSRYLISDAAVLLGKQVISAAALRAEGQLMVLNDPPLPPGNELGGPCYRCIFPKPPASASVVDCGEAGIIGPVVGIMGVYQALEAIKLITFDAARSKGESEVTAMPRGLPCMILFSPFRVPPFRSVRLRSRRAGCFTCSSQATVTPNTLMSERLDYLQLCTSITPENILDANERISAEEYNTIRKTGQEHFLVDVRERSQFKVCNLEQSINIPLSDLQRETAGPKSSQHTSDCGEDLEYLTGKSLIQVPIYVLCRLGNDSQLAVKWMKDAGWDCQGKRRIQDIRGGMKAWKEDVDELWSYY